MFTPIIFRGVASNRSSRFNTIEFHSTIFMLELCENWKWCLLLSPSSFYQVNEIIKRKKSEPKIREMIKRDKSKCLKHQKNVANGADQHPFTKRYRIFFGAVTIHVNDEFLRFAPLNFAVPHIFHCHIWYNRYGSRYRCWYSNAHTDMNMLTFVINLTVTVDISLTNHLIDFFVC